MKKLYAIYTDRKASGNSWRSMIRDDFSSQGSFADTLRKNGFGVVVILNDRDIDAILGDEFQAKYKYHNVYNKRQGYSLREFVKEVWGSPQDRKIN